MINEAENKATLNKMSDLEYVKNDTEMMRYRANGLSYKLGLGAMGFGLAGGLVCLNSYKPENIQVIIIILMNIVLLLGGFLAAEKVKNYSKQGAVVQVTFGLVSFVNMFYVPLILMINYGQYLDAYALKVEDFETPEAYLEAFDKTMGNAQNILAATITAKKSGSEAVAYLPASGYLRGGLAMGLFACAAALYIVAGIIGYLRARKLSNYLDSLKETK